MKFADLKDKPESELQKIMAQQQERLVRIRFAKEQGDLANPNEIKETRKTIARILTLLGATKTNSQKT